MNSTAMKGNKRNGNYEKDLYFGNGQKRCGLELLCVWSLDKSIDSNQSDFLSIDFLLLLLL